MADVSGDKLSVSSRHDGEALARRLRLYGCDRLKGSQGAVVIKLTGAAVLVLVFAVSAQAQSARGGGAHFTSTPSSYSESGGGGGGSAAAGGSRTLAHIAPAQFAVREVAGNSSDYMPSTFVSFSTAVAEGKAALAQRPKPLGVSAHESVAPAKAAKIEVVQGEAGKPTIEPH